MAVPHVLYDSAEVYIIDMMEKLKNNFKNNLRANEAQIVPKPKSNEPRPKFIGSYKRKTFTSVLREVFNGRCAFSLLYYCTAEIKYILSSSQLYKIQELATIHQLLQV